MEYLCPFDLDGDDDIDIPVIFLGNEMAWFENDGEQTFTKIWIDNHTEGGYGMDATDLDDDGDIDLIGLSWYDDRVTWYENNGDAEFTRHPIDEVIDGTM